ncbi:MAG: hypothetical protein MZV70_50480 [Desulfobacterales bacterium]|nr:hypothetical protein [Desulfobacterales bacterium]
MRWRSTGAALLAIAGPHPLCSAAALASGEGGGVTVIPDWSVSIQIVNFLFLIFALNLLLYRPIRTHPARAQGENQGDGVRPSENADQSVPGKGGGLRQGHPGRARPGAEGKGGPGTQAEAEERKLIEGDQRQGPGRSGGDAPEDPGRRRARAAGPAAGDRRLCRARSLRKFWGGRCDEASA